MTKIYIYDKTNKDINPGLLDALPDQIKDRVNKYKIVDDFNSSLMSWFILKNKLKEIFNIDIYNIKENKYHKPYIDDIYFNISHSYNLVVVIISNEECGIDIEHINNRLDHNLLSKKILSNSEYLEYLKVENKQDFIIKKWTEKEAVFKKNGTGVIRSELPSIDTSLIQTIKVKDTSNNEYYLSYVASTNADIEIIE